MSVAKHKKRKRGLFMRVCEVCGKKLSEGHIIYPDTAHTFYLCIECFEKFYGKDLEDYMYDNELQYYTEWSDEDGND